MTPRMHVVGLIYPILDNSLIIIMIGSNALLSAIGSIEVECFSHSRALKDATPCCNALMMIMEYDIKI